jgi:hypothetical protein
MYRKGPIPAFLHGLLDYVFGIFLIASPFLLAFSKQSAPTAVGIVAGVLLLVLAASTAWATGLIKSVPVQAHAVLDYILAGVLIASPFLFGFSDQGKPTAVFIIFGVFDLLWTIATRFEPRPRAEVERPAEGTEVAAPAAPEEESQTRSSPT